MSENDGKKRVKFCSKDLNDSVDNSVTENVSARRSRFHLDPNLRKLPPPVVFWSPWEKDAHRRNRAIQVELNKDLRHIAWQSSLSSRKIKHDAKQFRERICSFWPDPKVVLFGSGYPIRTASAGDKRNRGLRKGDRKHRSSTYLKFTGQIVKSAHSVAKQAHSETDSESYPEASSCDEDSDSSDISIIKPSSASIRDNTPLSTNSGRFRQRTKSETDLFKMRSKYITSEEVESKSPSQTRTERFSPTGVWLGNKESVIGGCPSTDKNHEQVGPRCSTTRAIFTGEDKKERLRFTSDKTAKLYNKEHDLNTCSREHHFLGNVSLLSGRRPDSGTFLFDRIKATYELKMELRRSARQKRLQPVVKKYDRTEDLAQEKLKHVVYQGKVRGYLEKLNSFLGSN